MIENYIGKEVRVGAGDNVTGCGVRGILKLTDGVYDCTGSNGSIQFKSKDIQYWNAFDEQEAGVPVTIRIQLMAWVKSSPAYSVARNGRMWLK